MTKATGNLSHKINILAIIGSASTHSSNLKLVEEIAMLSPEFFNIFIFDNLKSLPHFDPELSGTNPPIEVVDFRNSIEQADAVIICTPEYVFSIPSGLKNAIEWCIATTVFSNKPVGLITASASGEKGHESLQLIMKTVMARFTSDTTLLIQGVKGKFNSEGTLTDPETIKKINQFRTSLYQLCQN